MYIIYVYTIYVNTTYIHIDTLYIHLDIYLYKYILLR